MRDIEEYKSEFNVNKEFAKQQYDNNPSMTGSNMGKNETARNVGISDEVNKRDFNRLKDSYGTEFVASQTANENLQRQAKLLNMSEEEYLKTKSQKVDYIANDGSEITALYDKESNFIGQRRSITTDKGQLEEYQVQLEDGSLKTVKRTLDGNDITSKIS